MSMPPNFPAPFPPVNDNIILSQINIGDISGWDALYDKYASMMYGVILRLSVSSEEADEILVSVFLQLNNAPALLLKGPNLCLSLLQYINQHCDKRAAGLIKEGKLMYF